MMNRLSFVVILALAACAAESTNGLQLEIADDARVAGVFTRDGVALAFEFSRSAEVHTLAFSAADGQPLITTTLEGAYQTTTVFGGELVASGITNSPSPTILGDRAAMQRLHARPEAALLEGLHDALISEGVDEKLYDPQPPEVASAYDYDGRYFVFSPGDSRDWLSAAGASPTYVYAQNPWPKYNRCASVEVLPWSPAAPELIVVEPYGSAYKTGYWWGAIITVRNRLQSYVFGNRLCEGVNVLIRVSPYRWSP